MSIDPAYRTFVSYIDKSREYYLAQGYGNPYRWAFHEDAPFTPLARPLPELRVGVVTTAFPRDFDASGAAKSPYAQAAEPRPSGMFTEDLFWDKDATHHHDLGSYLPLDRLDEAAAQGRIGSASPRFYGAPTDYSQRRTRDQDAPRIAEWLREDDVDAALLVAL